MNYLSFQKLKYLFSIIDLDNLSFYEKPNNTFTKTLFKKIKLKNYFKTN